MLALVTDDQRLGAVLKMQKYCLEIKRSWNQGAMAQMTRRVAADRKVHGSNPAWCTDIS